ncbi:MAG: NAD(P)H-dependent oxidoreductase [Synergistaceae bacterium]|jgi:chromate reductase|nr:NAD(P)H-dependent oxidoreductase [Synergistaceae bacterium]
MLYTESDSVFDSIKFEGDDFMVKPKIFVLVGSFRRDSLNQKLFGFFKEEAGDAMAFDRFDVSSLPHFSEDIENSPPAEASDLKKRAAASDGVLVVTPEYNRSFPGVLKNALDWGSRPYGQSVWGGKPAGLIGTSPGAIGTFGAQSQIRQTLAFLDLRLMARPEFYFAFPKELDNGKLPASARDFLKSYVEAFIGWVTKK